jgi:hypothetical protein
MKRSVSLSVLIVVQMLGCGLLRGTPRTEIVMTTDKLDYDATYTRGSGAWKTYHFVVIVRTQNVGRRNLFLSHCTPGSNHLTYGVAMTDDTLSRSAYGPNWACVGSGSQPELAAGTSRVDTLSLTGPWAVTHDGNPVGRFSGPMKIYFGIHSCRGDGACIVKGAGASNVFNVRLVD